jgi:hypothetical protein
MARFELPRLPPTFAQTREALHRVAEEVVKPAREKATGEFSLIRTPGGFGTPLFGEDRQVRVEGAELVFREGGEERREALDVDPGGAAALAAAFEVGEAALERLREEAGPDDAPTQPTLWPEHFDIAIEMGPEGKGLRANYGMSPGDERHAQPYFYVGPWTAKPEGDLWNGKGFAGAEISYEELAAAGDPVDAAVDFARRRKRALEEGR